ncbi:MAG: ATP-binding protein [Caldiserica bacterium]|jgi:MinD superfamily P-loop ATPase|nr:ATP-binding protein [Caldisericota bacterium]MDH7562300.1 ATP-binding protein [Caldisericota bacterium]
MIISVASGKGGTGKTLVAVNMALSLKNRPLQFLDCDVEEPNAYLFFKPEITRIEAVYSLVPAIDEKLCDHCGKCAQFCQYNALLVTSQKAMVLPELCHSCGGCALVCPKKAITEEKYMIGSLKGGSAGNLELLYGELKVGKPLPAPIIKEVKRHIRKDRTVILDSPPGTSCPVIETVRGSDFCILVAEPTPFGLHDLKIAVQVLEELAIPFGVVLNRADIGDEKVQGFCNQKSIPILLEIPYLRKIAELYSKAIPFIQEMPEWKVKFQALFKKVERLCAQ